MNKQPLIIPIGIPAAGKSTASEALLSNGFPPEGIVSPDDYRTILTGDRADQTTGKLVFEIVDKIVYARVSRGLNVYLDATNLLPKNRLAYVEFASRHQVQVLYLRFPTTYEECVSRNSERLRPVPENVMERMQSNFQQFGSIEFLEEELGARGEVIETSDLTVQHIFY